MLTLRHDLDLIEGEAEAHGGKRWILRDPVNNRFFKLGSDEIRVLAYIKNIVMDVAKVDELAAALSQHLGKTFTRERLEHFLRFLRQNNLLSAAGPQARAELLRQRELLQPGAIKRLLREYLFIKVHLLNPDRILERLVPWTRWLFRPATWWLLALNTLVALYLTSRQFDTFVGSFVGYFTLEGMIYAGIALGLVKILHELGHALVARHFGCAVHSMGVAFLIFWPVLFTDTTDAWRLKNKRQRALIGASGVLTELIIASLSLTLWNFAPEGPLKMVLFILASTTWILTLAINLNPLMRFDGYFVLSDLWGVDNLQSRSFDLARWKLREWMFGFGFAPPEYPRPGLILYAFAVMIYRFFLFLGIALVIYHYFFKLLGLVLMTVQIMVSLVVPLSKEIREWWKHRARSRLVPNLMVTGFLMLFGLLWLVLPSQGSLSLPAYERAGKVTFVYMRESGRLQRLTGAEGASVEAGTVLVELELDEQRYELEQVDRDIAMLQAQLAALGVDTAATTPRSALVAQLRSAREKQSELRGKLAEASIVAPHAGTVKDLERELDPGQWVSAGTRLMTLLGEGEAEVIAYVSEQEVGRMQPGQRGSFHADGGSRAPVAVELTSIEGFTVDRLDELYAASSHGGDLQVRDAPDGEVSPLVASYRVHFRVLEELPPERVLRGLVEVETEGRSPLNRYWNTALSVWRRESGF